MKILAEHQFFIKKEGLPQAAAPRYWESESQTSVFSVEVENDLTRSCYEICADFFFSEKKQFQFRRNIFFHIAFPFLFIVYSLIPVVTTPRTNASCATNSIITIGRANTTHPAIIKCHGIAPYAD